MLILVAIFGGLQLKKLQEQNKLSRLIARKSSVQEVNKLIFQESDIFIPLLYGPVDKDVVKDTIKEGREATEKDKAKRYGMNLTAAYASLHALDTIYQMREGDNPDDEEERG